MYLIISTPILLAQGIRRCARPGNKLASYLRGPREHLAGTKNRPTKRSPTAIIVSAEYHTLHVPRIAGAVAASKQQAETDQALMAFCRL